MSYVFALKKLIVSNNVPQQGHSFQGSFLFCRVLGVGVCSASLGPSHCPVNARSLAAKTPSHISQRPLWGCPLSDSAPLYGVGLDEVAARKARKDGAREW